MRVLALLLCLFASQALAADAKAKGFWDTLSYSKQQWHVLQVTTAKTDATRDRRIEKSIGMLREGKAR